MQNNKDIVEPNNNGEIHPGSPIFVGHNFDLELYNCKIENYEVQDRDCWSIKKKP